MTVDPRLFICAREDGAPAAIAEVTVTKADRITEKTATQIEANNLAIRSICGAPPPPPAVGKAMKAVS